MLSGDDLVIAPCEGLGSALTLEEARDLADLLIARKDAEREEEERVRNVLSSRTIPPGKKVLVDGTGIVVL
jgi:hypothetical protein